jgi:hypothetical protein
MGMRITIAAKPEVFAFSKVAATRISAHFAFFTVTHTRVSVLCCSFWTQIGHNVLG